MFGENRHFDILAHMTEIYEYDEQQRYKLRYVLICFEPKDNLPIFIDMITLSLPHLIDASICVCVFRK